MLTKNSLTTNVKNLFLSERTAVVLKTGNDLEKVCVSKNRYLLECVYWLLKNNRPLVPKGKFFVPKNNQNNYAKLSTTNSRQQKTSLGKLVNKTQKKFNIGIIKHFFDIVKRKIALPILAQFKPKKRNFTEEDLKKLQNLFEKNHQNLQLAWKEFYQITGTNQNTFNN